MRGVNQTCVPSKEGRTYRGADLPPRGLPLPMFSTASKWSVYSAHHIMGGGVRLIYESARYILCAGLLAVLLLVSPAHFRAATSNRRTDAIQTSRGELRLTPLYHGSVMLEFGGKVIHVDPWSQGDFTGLPPADLIVVTH